MQQMMALSNTQENGGLSRPTSSGNPFSQAQSQLTPANGQPTPGHRHDPPQYDGAMYEYANAHNQAGLSHFSVTTPRPPSSHAQSNFQTPGARLPSPVVNQPTISPTQGNYDVGRLAGVPQTTPLTFPASSTNGAQRNQPQTNGTHTLATPRAFQQSPAPSSGLSPVKHTPNPQLPPPAHIPQKPSMSPPNQPRPTARSVSGTPIFPPAETLAPSPEQLNKTPVPTPSKQPTPAKIGEQELRRVSAEVGERTSIGEHQT